MSKIVNGLLTATSMLGTISKNCCIFRRAIQVYDELIRKTDKKEYYIYKACCYYALCQFDDSKREALKGP